MKLAWLERLAIAVASLVLSIVLIALLSGYFTRQDAGALSASSSEVVGETFHDQGSGSLDAGAPTPRYDSAPPTSGPHRHVAITRQVGPLDDDALLTALAAGDVVVVYGTPDPPPGLVSLARSLAGPFTPAVAADGDAVLLAPRAGVSGLIALGWTRMVRVSSPGDTLLSQFIGAWLGHGAPA